MIIVVCIKQVPDSTSVRINPETNTLMREGAESMVNPFDEYALELALALKDSDGAHIIVVSMGPLQATAVLRDALARGADEAFLVSSRAFGGADTLATSYTLSQAILQACGGTKPDLVLFGKQAVDGDTAQVGPGVSEFLKMPLVTYVRELHIDSKAKAFSATTVMDDGEYAIEGSLPAVMTILKEAAAPRFAPLAGAMSAAKAKIAVLDEETIAADPTRIGLKGSPTKVVAIFPPPSRGGGRKMEWNGDAAPIAAIVKEAING